LLAHLLLRDQPQRQIRQQGGSVAVAL